VIYKGAAVLILNTLDGWLFVDIVSLDYSAGNSKNCNPIIIIKQNKDTFSIIQI